MASGDESDTGDLTETDPSESGLSDESDGVYSVKSQDLCLTCHAVDEEFARTDPLVHLYARHSRHFVADRRHPSRWNASCFKLIKVSTIVTKSDL